MDRKIILSSLAMDLKRAAIGLYRGSDKMAQRFLAEAVKRKKEYIYNDLKPYMSKIMDDIEKLESKQKMASFEDIMMYSIIIQNYTLQHFG